MATTGKGFHYPEYTDTPDVPRDLEYLAEDVDAYLTAHPGPTGPTGPTGATGATGPTGPTGPTTYPSTGIAVSTGTAWDTSLLGTVAGQVPTWNGTAWTVATPSGGLTYVVKTANYTTQDRKSTRLNSSHRL